MQGRVDQYFASSSGRRVVHQLGAGSSNFMFQSEEESNVHWRTRPSSSVSPSPVIESAADFEKKGFMASPSTGKTQEEDFRLSMFRNGIQALGNQVIYGASVVWIWSPSMLGFLNQCLWVIVALPCYFCVPEWQRTFWLYSSCYK